MTKKANKDTHREIIDRNAAPDSEENRKAMEEIVYGDENNPNEKFHVGEDIIDVLRANRAEEEKG